MWCAGRCPSIPLIPRGPPICTPGAWLTAGRWTEAADRWVQPCRPQGPSQLASPPSPPPPRPPVVHGQRAAAWLYQQSRGAAGLGCSLRARVVMGRPPRWRAGRWLSCWSAGPPAGGLVQTHRTGPEQGCDGSPRVLAGVGGGGRVRRQGAPGVKAMLCPGAAPSRAAPIAAARLTGSSALKSKVMNQEGGSCVLRPCSGCSGRQVPVSQSCKCSHPHTGLRPQDFSFQPLLPPREQPQCGWPAGPQRPCLPA